MLTVELRFTKCHGSGNDFVMIDQHAIPPAIQPEQLSKLSQVMCDRSGPLGGDGILIVAPSETLDGKMIMYNTDGTEAEMCGNGMRCVARKLITNQSLQKLEVETKNGSVVCWKVPEIYPGVYSVSEIINPINLQARDVPIHYNGATVVNTAIPEVDPDAQFTALSIPNPHLIAIVPEIETSRLLDWGKAVVANPSIFPNGMNVSMVRKVEDNHIFVSTNERGCGLTAACGTAISSSSYVSCLNGICQYNQPILVQTEGGISYSLVENEDATGVTLTGNATYVYEATARLNANTLKIEAIEEKTIFEEENSAYAAMLAEFQERAN